MTGLLGEELTRATLERLPRHLREPYLAVDIATPLPVHVLDDIYYAVARGVRRDALPLHWRIVQNSVRSGLRNIWRTVVRSTSDAELVRRIPSIFLHAFSRGTIQARFIQPGMAEVRLTDWPGASELRVNDIDATVHTVLSSARLGRVRTTPHSTIDGGCILVTWRVD
ncbi:MAG: hypothetical protein AAF411_14270 [Myxococcota bacterium]